MNDQIYGNVTTPTYDNISGLIKHLIATSSNNITDQNIYPFTQRVMSSLLNGSGKDILQQSLNNAYSKNINGEASETKILENMIIFLKAELENMIRPLNVEPLQVGGEGGFLDNIKSRATDFGSKMKDKFMSKMPSLSGSKVSNELHDAAYTSILNKISTEVPAEKLAEGIFTPKFYENLQNQIIASVAEHVNRNKEDFTKNIKEVAYHTTSALVDIPIVYLNILINILSYDITTDRTNHNFYSCANRLFLKAIAKHKSNSNSADFITTLNAEFLLKDESYIKDKQILGGSTNKSKKYKLIKNKTHRKKFNKKYTKSRTHKKTNKKYKF